MLPRNNCTNCGPQHNLFNPSQSTTFSSQPGYWEPVYFGGTTSTGEQEQADCSVVTDTVRMAGHSALQQQFLLCGSYSEGLAALPSDGIFGLGSTIMNTWYFANATYRSVYWNLVQSGELPGPEFGISYTRKNQRDGVLTLGGTDTSLYKTETLETVPLDWPLSESGNRWVVGVTSTWVNHALLAGSTNAVALVDTGFSNMVTPDWETAQELYSHMSSAFIVIKTEGFYTYWGAPCSTINSLAKEVWFQVGSASNHANVIVKAEHINEGPDNSPGVPPGYCRGLFASPLQGRPAREPFDGRPAWVLGNKLLKSYYTVWNGADHTLGFAQPKDHQG